MWGIQAREKQVMLTRGCVSVVEALTYRLYLVEVAWEP